MTDDRFHQKALDTRALELATEAKSLINAHIQECSDNQKLIMARFDKLRDDLNSTVNRGLIWFIGLLVLCLGYFLTRFGLPGIH